MAIVYLCLGSNKTERLNYIQQATSLLGMNENIKIIRTSAIYETEPWGNKDQGWFVNAILEASVKCSPEELLKICNEIEIKLGRNRDQEQHWGERSIDIDIIFYDDLVIQTENLTIPHIYMHERAFVLVPLLELIPDFVHPIFKKTVMQLYEELPEPEGVLLYGTHL